MLNRCCAAVLLLTLVTACGNDSGPDADEPAPTSSTPVGTTDEQTPSASDEPGSVHDT